MSRARDESGQTLVLTVLFMTVILGMSALVLDVGSWYHADRRLQATADASALAAAQDLPVTGTASSTGSSYADTNYAGSTKSITFSSDLTTNDTVTVALKRDAPGFFSKVFSIDTVNVGARAVARSHVLYGAGNVTPIVVSDLNPYLACYRAAGPTCYTGTPTVLVLNERLGAGNWAIVDLRGLSASGAPGTSTVTDWIRNGYPATLYPGLYDSAPGVSYNSSQFQAAMESRYYATCHCEVLLPVFSGTPTRHGSNFTYQIVGWVGFRITLFSAHGSPAITLTGSFTHVIWDGVESNPGASATDFGARKITLVE